MRGSGSRRCVVIASWDANGARSSASPVAWPSAARFAQRLCILLRGAIVWIGKDALPVLSMRPGAMQRLLSTARCLQCSHYSPCIRIQRYPPALVTKVDPPVGDSVTFGGSNSLTSLKTSSFLKSFIFVALTIFNGLDPMKRVLDDARFNQASHSGELMRTILVLLSGPWTL